MPVLWQRVQREVHVREGLEHENKGLKIELQVAQKQLELKVSAPPRVSL